MTRGIERLVIFAFGVGLGSIGSGFFFKKQYDKIAKKFRKDIDDLEAYYKSKMTKPAEAEKSVEPDTEDIDVELYKASKPVDIAKSNPNETPKGPAIDYTQFYNPTEVEELNDIYAKSEMAEDEERKAKGLQVLDSPVDFGSIPYYSAYDILYYTEDEVLVLETEDGDEKMLDEIADKIQQKIDETGFKTSKDAILWLIYPNRAAYYQVTKVVGRYSDP